jgi:hypothetical protein
MQEVSEAYRSSARVKHETPMKPSFVGPLFCSIGALIGVFGGISILFAGLISVIIHYAISGDVVFDRVGTVFLISAIPMLLIGSIFLDTASPSK